MENYYVRCVFCLTGTENTVIRRIEAQGLGHAISPRKIQPMKIQGQWIDRETLLMPGYVFIYGDTDKPMHALRATEGVIRVLTYGGQDNDGYLKNEDLDFALRIRRFFSSFFPPQDAGSGLPVGPRLLDRAWLIRLSPEKADSPEAGKEYRLNA